MTHDELLGKIEAAIDVEYFKESWLALRAVVELAQPRTGISFSEDYDDGYTDAMAKVIQAIKKELA